MVTNAQKATFDKRLSFSQAHIKLNPKKLYQSDGYSVKELLKVRPYNDNVNDMIVPIDVDCNDFDGHFVDKLF